MPLPLSDIINLTSESDIFFQSKSMFLLELCSVAFLELFRMLSITIGISIGAKLRTNERFDGVLIVIFSFSYS